MEKAIIDYLGKSGIVLSFIFNLIEWQTINIIFTCALSLLSCIYIILKICSWCIDIKIKKESNIKENRIYRSPFKKIFCKKK